MITSPNVEHLEVLTCWKDIARYMGKGVRTVQRWEQQFDLPVHRPLGAVHKSSIIAHPHDLNAWVETRWSGKEKGTSRKPSSPIQAATPAAVFNTSDLSSGIRTSRELRHANHALVHEIAASLHNLVQNFDQFTVQQQQYRRPTN